MGWYPECCEPPEIPCLCPGKMLLTISGATDKKCSNNLSGTYSKQLVNGGGWSLNCTGLGITSVTCGTYASHNPAGAIGFDPGLQSYNANTASCSVSTPSATAMFLDSDDYLWVMVVNQSVQTTGFVTQTTLRYWYFKSDATFSTLSPGDTIAFSFHTTCAVVSSGTDPGVNEMPFDASTCTISAEYVGCCSICQDATPDVYTVTLDEPANDNGLTDCASIAGTYELQRTTVFATCTWSLCSNSYDGGSVFVLLEKYWLLGSLYTKVTVRQYTQPNCQGSVLHTAVFQKVYTYANYGLLQDCDELDTVIPFSFQSGFGCDFSGVECLVTAVLE